MTTALLLQHLAGWSQCNPSTGEQSLQDTTTYPIAIGVIRQANIKLIRYEALKQITQEQECIIKLHQEKDIKYEEIISTFQDRIDLANQINQDLSEAIKREQRRNHIYLGVGIGVAAVIIVGLICK